MWNEMFLNSHITFFLIRLELKRKYIHTLQVYCWLWFRQTQTLSKRFSAWFTQTSRFLIFLYTLEKHFATYFELIGSKYNYAQFYCLDLDLWLANFKIFVSNFVWKASVRLVDAL